MNSPTYYINEIETLGVLDLHITVSSKAEAKQLLADLTLKQKQLRLLKSQINHDEQEIRLAYQAKRATAGATSSSLASLFGQRKLASNMRADAKRGVTSEQNEQLAPYAKIKFTIDDLIVQIDGAKLDLRDYLQQADED